VAEFVFSCEEGLLDAVDDKHPGGGIFFVVYHLGVVFGGEDEEVVAGFPVAGDLLLDGAPEGVMSVEVRFEPGAVVAGVDGLRRGGGGEEEENED